MTVTVIGALGILATGAQAQDGIFTVREFGAEPGAEADAGPAIRAAVAAAVEAGPGSEVILEPGVYRIEPAADQPYCLPIHRADGLMIRGAGPETELVVTRPDCGVFMLGLCTDITVAALTIDYDPLPFTQGGILAVDVDGGSFDLRVDEGYLTPDAPNFAASHPEYGKWGMVIERDTRRIKTGTPDHYMTPTWEQVEEGVYRFFTAAEHYRRGLIHMAVGDSYVHLARGHGNAIIAQGCTDVTLENIRIHASPSLAIGLVANNGEAIVRGVEVMFREGTDRLLTTNADGVHCQQNRAQIIIEDCLFEGMADDAVNIYAPPNVLREIRSPTEWLVTPGCIVLPGERLQVFDPTDGVLRGYITATDVQVEDGLFVLTLDEPLPGARAGEDSRTADTLYNVSACGAGFVIRGNTMRGHRRYGCMLRAGDGLVEGNLFEDTTGAGVVLLNEPDWPEGPVPWGTTVRGNRFVRGGTCLGYADSPNGAQLVVRAVKLGHGLAQGRPIEGVTIEDNQFIDPLGASVYLGGVDELTMRGNTIRSSRDVPRLRGSAAIVVEDSQGASILDTRVDDPRDATTAAIQLLPSVAGDPEGTTIEDLDASLHDDAQAIIDMRL
jgi:hypothetical protein